MLKSEFPVVGLLKGRRKAEEPGEFLFEIFPMNDFEIGVSGILKLELWLHRIQIQIQIEGLNGSELGLGSRSGI